MNWQDVVSAATNERLFGLASERGIVPGMLLHLRSLGLIGWFKGGPAFPIANSAGEVIGSHSRLPLVKGQRKKWHYEWFVKQKGISPLVFGNLETAAKVWVFESQWDAIAALALHGWHSVLSFQKMIAAVSTRGAENGAKLRGLIPAGKHLLAFPQNDPVDKPGKPAAAQKWLADVVAHAGSPVLLAETPPQFKDFNDWVRAGAKVDDLQAAIKAAQPAVVTPQPAAVTPSIEVTSFDDQDEDLDDENVPFPTEALPPPYCDMVREVARVAQVPEAIPGMTMLAAISTAIGPALKTELVVGKITRGNLFILGVARSGTGKSSASEDILSPLHELDSARLEQWNREVKPVMEARRRLLTAEIERITKSVKKLDGDAERAQVEHELIEKQVALQALDDALIAPRLILEDVTSQKLALTMQQNGEAMSIITTDGGDVVNNLLGRYSKLDRADDALVVKAFSGDPCFVDRLGREAVRLKHPWLTILLWVQPEKRDTLFRSRQLVEGGYLPRCLIADVDVTLMHLLDYNAGILAHVRSAYTRQVTSLTETFRFGKQLHLITAAAEARKIIKVYGDEVIDQRNATVTWVDSFRARWTEQACRLSIVLHAAKWGAAAATHILDAETVQAGVTLARWFGQQQLLLLGDFEAEAREQVLTGLQNLGRKKPQGFTVRDVCRMRICAKANEATRCLKAFVSQGLLSRDDLDTGGRPTVVYRFNLGPI